MASSITEAELLEALNEALGDAVSEDGYTTREVQAVTGWGPGRARRVMTKLITTGAWEAVTVLRMSPLRPGTAQPICGYRPVVPSD